MEILLSDMYLSAAPADEEITEEDFGISYAFQTAFQIWWMDRQSCIDTENIWGDYEDADLDIGNITEEDLGISYSYQTAFQIWWMDCQSCIDTENIYTNLDGGPIVEEEEDANVDLYDDLGKAFIRNVY